MWPVLFDHADGKNDERALAVERIDERPREFREFVAFGATT